jgi:hypothetical protein
MSSEMTNLGSVQKIFVDSAIYCLKNMNTPKKCNVSDAQILDWLKDANIAEVWKKLGQQSTTSRLYSEPTDGTTGSELSAENYVSEYDECEGNIASQRFFHDMPPIDIEI